MSNKQKKLDSFFKKDVVTNNNIESSNNESNNELIIANKLKRCTNQILDLNENNKTTATTNDPAVLINLNDKYNSGPIQPVFEFPTTNQRKFCSNWYNQFKWLEYSVTKDAAFCYYCRIHGTSSSKYNNSCIFNTTGFSNWKNALAQFKKHEETQIHKNASLFHINRVANESDAVLSKLDDQYSKEIQNKKYILSKIFEAS